MAINLRDISADYSKLPLGERASIFARKAHEGANQVRKYTNEPYIVHPAAVVEWLIRAQVRGAKITEEMYAAAWLHDTVEDTAATVEDIKAAFGPSVALLVWYLTDFSTPQDGNRARRKHFYMDHLSKAPPEAKTIKLADIIDNVGSIAKHDPKFAVTYIKEKEALLPVLIGGDTWLWEVALDVIKQAKEEITTI